MVWSRVCAVATVHADAIRAAAHSLDDGVLARSVRPFLLLRNHWLIIDLLRSYRTIEDIHSGLQLLSSQPPPNLMVIFYEKLGRVKHRVW